MDTIECIRTRFSVRKFKPEPVARELLEDIIDAATRSPSYKNTQPWEVVVLSGAGKEALSKRMVELFEKGAPPCPDIPEPQSWPTREQDRINHLFKTRAELTGIDLSDPKITRRAKIANFNFYGAPHAIYLYQDASLTPWSLFDLGLFAQTLMLAAHTKGLGTVPQAFATDYAQHIKEYLDIPADKRLVLGISIGYPDISADEKIFRTDRDGVGEITRWF